MSLNFMKYNYQMKKRSKRSMINETFNSSDVIYLIAPIDFLMEISLMINFLI